MPGIRTSNRVARHTYADGETLTAKQNKRRIAALARQESAPSSDDVLASIAAQLDGISEPSDTELSAIESRQESRQESRASMRRRFSPLAGYRNQKYGWLKVRDASGRLAMYYACQTCGAATLPDATQRCTCAPDMMRIYDVRMAPCDCADCRASRD